MQSCPINDRQYLIPWLIIKTRLNIQEVAAPVAAPVAAGPVEAEEAPVEVRFTFCARTLFQFSLSENSGETERENYLQCKTRILRGNRQA